MEIEKIENLIGVTFSDKALLERVFSHSSYSNDVCKKSNENLEFLGDAVLDFVISTILYKTYDEKQSEGEMSKIRARVVSTNSLVKIAQKLGICEFLEIKNLSENAKNKNAKYYADLVEAVIAGIFLDKGLKEASSFIKKNFADIIKLETPERAKREDFKTTLQELVQKDGKKHAISYAVVEKSGADHAPTFTISLTIDGKVYAMKKGENKKVAEAECAKSAIKQIGEER